MTTKFLLTRQKGDAAVTGHRRERPATWSRGGELGEAGAGV